MRTTAFFILLFLILSPLLIHGQVRFIENKGQWENNILYRAPIAGGMAFVTKNAVRYVFNDKKKLNELHHGFTDDSLINSHAVFIEFIDASPHAELLPSKPYSEYYNFYTSRNPDNWKTGVKGYGRIYSPEIYPSTDLEIESEDDALKYTYYLKPGTNPSKIRMRIRGADKLELKDRQLHIYTSVNHIIEQAPYAYQLNGSDTIEVKCDFYLDKEYAGFRFPQGYNSELPLIIDPKVIFATFSGSTGDNFGFTATYDTLGHGYSGGTVYNPGFPVTPGAFQVKFAGGKNGDFVISDIARDAGILKYSPDGTKLLFATYLGGTHNEEPHSMVVDSQNNLIVFGTTFSRDFPITKTAYDTLYSNRGDIFVSKFSEDGSKLLASTFIGDTLPDGLNGTLTIIDGLVTRPLTFNYGDQFRGEVVSDKFNNIYVATCTQSPGFPVTPNAPQVIFGGGTQDGCAFKLNPDFSKLLWSTFIGGTKYDAAYSIQLDKQQNAFVTGGTESKYFFKDSLTYKNILIGDSADAFICHIKSDGKSIINATYFGTDKYDQAFFIQLDPNQDPFIFGQTTHKNFPVINAKYANPGSGQFIAKLNYNLDKVLISTVFGSGTGIPNISPGAFLVDDCGSIYVSGWGGKVNEEFASGGNTFNMPITPDGFQKNTDGSDFYLAVYARDMEALLYGSFFGGNITEEHVDGGTSRFDKRGVVYQSVCGGCGGLSDFPTTPGAWSRRNLGIRPDGRPEGCNNLLFKVDLNVPDIKVDFIIPPSACNPHTLRPQNTSLRANTFFWDFGDGTTSTLENPVHIYTVSDTYTVKLIAYNSLSCGIRDSALHQIYIYGESKSNFSINYDSCSNYILFDTTGALGNSFFWDFGDTTFSQIPNPPHIYKDTGTYIVTLISDPGTKCADTLKKEVLIYKPDFSFVITDTCTGTIQITGISTKDSNLIWIFDTDTIFTQLPLYKFNASGNHNIKLIINKFNGCTDTIKKSIKIPELPKANFTYTLDSCSRTLTIKNLSPSANSYLWSFGDGTISTSKDPQNHIFSSDGNYTIALIVNPGTTCADTSVQTILIKRVKAEFTFEVDSCTGEISFINQSLPGAKSFLWIFDDGKTSNSKSPKHTFSNNGIFNVQLVVNPGTACADFFTLQIKADSLPGSNLEFPNIITLNNDGFNDDFRISGFNFKCDDYELLIFNRWGQLLFKDRGTDLVWKGTTLKGELVEAGVYYYIFKSEATSLRQGTITVVR